MKIVLMMLTLAVLTTVSCNKEDGSMPLTDATNQLTQGTPQPNPDSARHDGENPFLGQTGTVQLTLQGWAEIGPFGGEFGCRDNASMGLGDNRVEAMQDCFDAGGTLTAGEEFITVHGNECCATQVVTCTIP